MSTSEKRMGFTGADQEEIATKFQRLSDERGRRSGLGFSKASTSKEVEDERVRKLKSSVNSIMKDCEKTRQHSGSDMGNDHFSKYKVYEALNDEDTVSLAATMDSNDLDSIHNRAIFSGDKVEFSPVGSGAVSDVPISDTRQNQIPLFKSIKVGDVVKALYQDGKYYEAEVLAVIHGGYPSAKYDIKFKGYEDVVCVSWKAVQLPDGPCEEVGRALPMREGAEQPTKNQPYLDEFGRERRINESAAPMRATTHSPPSQVSVGASIVVPPCGSTPSVHEQPIVPQLEQTLLHPFLQERPKGAWKSKR